MRRKLGSEDRLPACVNTFSASLDCLKGVEVFDWLFQVYRQIQRFVNLSFEEIPKAPKILPAAGLKTPCIRPFSGD
jgi:hypothetical protein